MPHLGPIYMLNQHYAVAEREGGIAQAEQHDSVWRASRLEYFAADAIPDAYSRPDLTHFPSIEDALLHSTLLTTEGSPAAYLTTLAEAIRQVSCVAAYWDWTVVVAAVGVEEAASIAAVAHDDDYKGEATRVPPRQRFREQVAVSADQLVNLLSHEHAAVREFALELAAAVES